MVRFVKYISPKIKTLEDTTFEKMVIDDIYYNSRISVLPDSVIDIENVTIDGCYFDKIDFEMVNFKNVDFWDTIFNSCSFSNKDFVDRSFNRCHFINCKLVGSMFENCSFDNVKFEECNLKYSSFFKVKFKNVIFEKCILDDARFYDISDVKDVLFLNSSMISVDIVKCLFRNVDFSSNDIYGIRTDFNSVKTNVFSMEQALMLTKMLEIEIKSGE